MRALTGACLCAALATALSLLACLACAPSDRRSEEYYFGTLQTDPKMARTEREHGIEVAHMTIAWERFEPTDGEYDSAYIAGLKATLHTFQEAGVHVEVGLGLNHPPQWLLEQYPDDVFVDQSGRRQVSLPNVVFSQAVRDEVESYVRGLSEEIDLNRFWAIRVGVNEAGEFTYPPPSDGAQAAYWAFDRNAQAANGAAHGRPDTVPPNPFPGWRPDERTLGGAPFTRQQVARWYDWYLAALADAVNWQTRQFRSLGYRSLLKVLVPGTGMYPRDRMAAVDGHLGNSVSTELTGRGAAFFRTIDHLEHNGKIQIVSTALVNGSGTPANNVCQPRDANPGIDGSSDVEVRAWSSVRWVSRIATEHGFPVAGESAGPQVAAYYPGVMDTAARQMKACGLKGLMWAFDRNLYDGTPGSSLREYAVVIHRSK